MNTWTEQQLSEEWRYIYEERIGILTDGRGNETPEQDKLARAEAHVAKLKAQEKE